MRKNKFIDSISGKGYYIALILCAVAIGISGYLYYHNANEPASSMNAEPSAEQPLNSDVQTAVTHPGITATEPTDVPTTQGSKLGKITKPVSGETVTPYAMDALCYNQTTRDWRVHNGIDIAAQSGSEVFAAADGTVYTVYEDEAMGMTVVIRHNNGYVTRYSSLSEDIRVSAGETVTAGQVIGIVGCTSLLETAIGDHVHFSVTCNGQEMDPDDFFELG